MYVCMYVCECSVCRYDGGACDSNIEDHMLETITGIAYNDTGATVCSEKVELGLGLGLGYL